MPYDWIETEALPPIKPGERLVLFGAGNGSRELLRHLDGLGARARVLGVLDNDPTLHGRSFQGLPVSGPESLEALRPCRVIVTTVSGREAVSAQLRELGLERDRDFFLVGRFPFGRSLDNLALLLRMLREHDLSARGELLQVGPGGFLGLECGVMALLGGDGPSRCVAVDALNFSMRWPDVTEVAPLYAQARRMLLDLARQNGFSPEETSARWDALFHVAEGRTRLDADRAELRFPHRFSALPAENDAFGLACSFAVLEHVRQPQKAVDELWRVLRPGGAAILTVITRDHRSFGAAPGYTPISYRAHTPEEWECINRNKFPQNRLAPFQWRELFEKRGFRLPEYRVLHRYEASEQELAGLHPDFRSWDPERQSEVDCLIVAVKP